MMLDPGEIIPDTLSVLLTGPMLRRLTRTQVSVFAALRLGSDVTLHVTDADPAGTPGESTASATPLQIGKHLWVVLLTADGLDGGQFLPGKLYAYRLNSPGWPADKAPDWQDFAVTGQTRPTFLGLPTDLGQFRVLHTSCRRAHSARRDGMGHAIELVNDAARRPCLMVLSGDQAYCDSVASALMTRVLRIATDLIKIDEYDPGGVFGAEPKLAGRGKRNREVIKLSSGARNHLWTLAEFYAFYLLLFSEALWPPGGLPTLAQAQAAQADFPPDEPDGESIFADELERWPLEKANLDRFRAVLPGVRKTLANVPTLMNMDDHEATDDWNLDFLWVKDVYGTVEGRQLVANALLAYLVFQHWGNNPAAFTPGSPERTALDALQWTPEWETARPAVSDALLQTLGVPTQAFIDSLDPQPPIGVDLRDLNQGVRYDYRLGPTEGYPLHLVFLDERTARQMTGPDTPAGRIAPAALDLMWPAPQGAEADLPTLLVAPAPILGMYLIEHLLQPLVVVKGGDREAKLEFEFETWSLWGPAFENVLARIGQWRRVAILSGDVHFGYCETISYRRPHDAPVPSRAVQFVTSGAKLVDANARMLQLLGDFGTKVGLIRTKTFYGYQTLTPQQRDALEVIPVVGAGLPPDDVADLLLGRLLRLGQFDPVAAAAAAANAYGLGPPDWSYIIEHIDDERLPAAGPLLQAMQDVVSTGPWDGWNPLNSAAVVRGLRASDLHRIGRVAFALSQVARISFQPGPTLVARQETFYTLGDDPAGPIETVITEASLG